MKLFRKFFFLYIKFLIFNVFGIKVLLEKKDINSHNEIHNIIIENINGIVINDFYGLREPFLIDNNVKIIEFMFKGENWYMNGRKLGIKNLSITPSIDSNTISIHGKKYEGKINIIIKNKTMYIVNELSLESYIEGVLASETYHDWSNESHRVSAIIARTYAYEKILRNISDIYDIQSSIVDQKYDGISNNKDLKKAVNETQGIIIIKNNRPIIAMYTSCCGGVIPAKCRGFDFKNHPYLAREYPCNYCKNSSNYTWTILIKKNELKRKLELFLGKSISIIKGIYSIGKTKSGTISYIDFEIIIQQDKLNNIKKKINQKSTIVKLYNRDIRQLFSLKLQNNSAHFSIIFDCNAGLIIKGNGMGHHIGLCQWGAKFMADNGKTYQEILKYYYPKTQLSYIDTAQI